MIFTIGTCRRVTRWGSRGVRIGEASNPGPASKRRRTQRLRALQRSMDSESEDDRPLVSTSCPEVFAMSDLEDSLEDDPTTGIDQPLSKAVGGRRLVLLPQSSGGTPRSVCDRSSDEGIAALRGPPDVRSPAVSHNRFTPLDGQEAADTADHRSQWGSPTQRVW